MPLLLRALDPRWRPIFAAALYTGLRKGELLALRKSDVDLVRQVLTVARSHERDTTKGGHADVIPVATELVPFLRVAMAASPSDLVFPKADGTRMRADVNLEWTLRRALGRAGWSRATGSSAGGRAAATSSRRRTRRSAAARPTIGSSG